MPVSQLDHWLKPEHGTREQGVREAMANIAGTIALRDRWLDVISMDLQRDVIPSPLLVPPLVQVVREMRSLHAQATSDQNSLSHLVGNKAAQHKAFELKSAIFYKETASSLHQEIPYRRIIHAHRLSSSRERTKLSHRSLSGF
jgi:hypothetical protein